VTHPLVGKTPEQFHDWFWQVAYPSGKWEPGTQRLLEEILHPGDLFVDIGAWIGPVTLWAVECGSQVIAVEPDPVALPELRRVTPESVEIWEGAVAVQPGTAKLTAPGKLGISGSRLAAEGEVEVRTWTLPEILADRKPALVKIDIEGYEIDLLPKVAPYLAELGVPLQVALHGTMPDREWFEGYRDVHYPKNPHHSLVAKP
jgi:FkbM family methyltransferase